MTAQKNWVIDANIVLRNLLQDLPEHSSKVESLLERAEAGEVVLLLPEPVISDVIYVLSSMKIPKVEIVSSVRDWLNLPGVMPLGIEIEVIHTALDLFIEKNIKWSDALIASRMFQWNCMIICTFDAHFSRIPGITAVMP